ncbi:MAG: hypothetical protein GY817_01040 [bacterium]|nr:hypothetical protein [bacterium]
MVEETSLDVFKKLLDKELVSTLTLIGKIQNSSRKFALKEEDNIALQTKIINALISWMNKQKIKNTIVFKSGGKDKTPSLCVVVNSQDANRTVMVVGHLDKQTAEKSEWSKDLDPYDPRVKDAHLFGRGMVDGAISFISTILMIKAF